MFCASFKFYSYFVVSIWQKLCSPLGSESGYLSSASTTMVIGEMLNRLARSMRTEIADIKTFCIGHSLGAHICGFSGKRNPLDVIIGIDPAGPIFESNSINGRLTENDAKVVQAIHTTPGMMGITKPIGDIDIYINEGPYQPDCLQKDIICSHVDFPLYFLEHIWETSDSDQNETCYDIYKCSNGRYIKVITFANSEYKYNC